MKKCALVVYCNSRRRPKDSEWALSLGPNRLQRQTHYLYLGVYLEERLSWQMQYDKVIKSARCASWKVSRWARLAEAKGKVTLPVVRQLVLACVRSTFGYAIPIWRPTLAQVKTFQRVLVTPLRTCLGLPRTTSYTGIMIECAIPDVLLWMEHLALRLARRVALLPRGHSARDCFELSRNDILPIERAQSSRYFTSLPFGLLIFAIEARWFGLDEIGYFGVDAGVRTRETFLSKNIKLDTKELLLRHYTSAVVNDKAKHLRTIKFDPGLSPYLLKDSRKVASIRARFRLDRAKLNASLHQRNLSDTDICAFCHSQNSRIREPETPEHLLLHCRLTRNARKNLIDDLRDLHPHLNLDLRLLLGEWPTKLGKDAAVMRLLRDYLLFAHRVRDT